MRVDPARSSPAAEPGADAGARANRQAHLAFALTAATLLFFLQALSVLLASEFSLAYEAVYPEPRVALLLLALLPAAALLAPALPFSLWLDRRLTIAGVAAAGAIARMVVGVADPRLRLIAAVLVVACGAVFLGKIVGFMGRRVVAAAAATALTLDPMLRLSGWSWDPTLRPSWVPLQVPLSLAVIALAVAWWRVSRMEAAHANDASLERRAGGVRLRGAVAAACVLFLDQAVLGRPEAIAHWTAGSYEIAAAVTIVAGAAAAALLLTTPDPIGSERLITLALAAMAAGATAIIYTGTARGAAALAIAGLARAGALLLLDRALVPAGGRRRGWRLATGLLLLLGLHAAYGLTFFPAQTWPALHGQAITILLGAGLLLTVSLVLTPRPMPAPPPLGRPAVAVLGVAAYCAAAVALALRGPSLPTSAPAYSPEIGVATYNIHYGFDEHWRYDPEAIARAIEDAGAEVVALQEAVAGVPALYGTDLPLWLGRRLGMNTYFAPRVNGLIGEAVLTRRPAAAFTRVPLPARSDAAQLVTLRIEVAGRTVVVHSTHLSERPDRRGEQLTSLIDALAVDAAQPEGSPTATPSILAGDLNAQPGGPVARALERVGFRDAFDAAGARAAPTAPAERPSLRIDWIWIRGLDVLDASVLAVTASDHRPVRATVRLRD